LDSILSRLSCYESNLNVIINTLLDPRYKTKPVEKLPFYKDALLQLRNEYDANLKNSSSSNTLANREENQIENLSKRLKRSSLQSDLETTFMTPEKTINLDLELYLSSPTVGNRVVKELNGKICEVPFCIIEYWKNYQVKSFVLSSVVKKYLCMLPTSVFSEQTFSGSSDIYTKDRNRLDPDNGEILMFIKKNIDLSKY
jgi:hypothetical protein